MKNVNITNLTENLFDDLKARGLIDMPYSKFSAVVHDTGQDACACDSCNDKGYLEVTHEDDHQYIEACDSCDYFGIMGDVDKLARDKAVEDGYKLTKTGKIKE